LVAVGAAAGLVGGADAAPGQAKDPCGIPTSGSVWIDYAEGSVAPDVRALFAQPGVVVTASGTVIPKQFRDKGAATTYFELHLPTLVGQPGDPNDPASIDAIAEALFQRASVSTACATPVIALNELFGESLKTPWSASNELPRERPGADEAPRRPGRQAGALRPRRPEHRRRGCRLVASGGRRRVDRLRAVLQRRAALGAGAGARLPSGARGCAQLRRAVQGHRHRPGEAGIALGFHSSRVAGIGGRQGLEPVEAWLRVVKWQAISTAPVAKETGLASIWSWGWALFGADDPDKLVTACAYLWARDPKLCDAPTKAGPAFNASRTEGQIALPAGATCTFAGGTVATAAVDGLAAVLHNRHEALSAAFSGAVLQSGAAVSDAAVAAAEQAAIARFRGKQRGYLEALTRSHATLAVARGVIRDELSRRATAQKLASSGGGETTLQWTAEHEASAVATAICLHDDLPGSGDFPVSENREVGVVPVLARLRFLFGDRAAPATPSAPVATPGGAGIVAPNWSYGAEPDLAGYRVYRSTASGGPYQPVGPFLDRSALIDGIPRGTTGYYVIRALDTSGNASAPSAEVAATTR